MDAKAYLQERLATAGITVNGSKPWDFQVNNDRVYARVLEGGTMAVGDSYVDGWWDVERLDQLLERIFRAGLYHEFAYGLRARLFNQQTLRRSMKVAEQHYNLGNDVFQAMLDRRMNYTCGYWNGATSLDRAQEAKLELVCQKLELEPGMTVLEFGCGWGAFAKYAAERHGARIVAYNIASEQLGMARLLCRGLPVEFRQQDYREAQGTYDRVVSIGIFEHVGHKNHRTYMETAARCLKPDGIAFIHTIAQNSTQYKADAWFDRNIFPNSVTPSLRQLGAAMEGLFVLEDLHNIGPNYDPTLMAWHENLTRNWPDLKRKYGERFYRMMSFYLLASAGVFRSRQSQLFQLVMTKPGRFQPDCRPVLPHPAFSLRERGD